MALVALTALDGTTVQVDTTEVASLTPVPTNALPVGVNDGTFVAFESGSRIGVQGTVAAVTALLGTGLVGATVATIDGAGAILSNNGGLLSSVRNGVGDYTLILVAGSLAAGCFVQCNSAAGLGDSAIVDQQSATQFAVLTSSNAAGVPTPVDTNFNFLVIQV